MNFPLTYGIYKIGLPLIVVKLFGNNICLMLDTGSNRNIIDHRIYDHFKDKLKQSETSDEVYTLNGAARGIKIDVPFCFENHDYQEPFLCTDLTDTFDKTYEESGIQIHGILGNNFFLKYSWILDFDKATIYKNQ